MAISAEAAEYAFYVIMIKWLFLQQSRFIADFHEMEIVGINCPVPSAYPYAGKNRACWYPGSPDGILLNSGSRL